jgi:preprotein translocase subunit SecE
VGLRIVAGCLPERVGVPRGSGRSEEMQFSRYVNLSFALAGLLLWVILSKLFATLFLTFEVTDAHLLGPQVTLSAVIALAVSVGGTLFAWRHPQVQTWSSEVAVELSKVTWPSWAETKQNTLIVIVFSLVVSGIIASFDLFWKWLTDLLLL